MNHEQMQIMEVFADLAALVIEHNQLVEEARNTQILEATESCKPLFSVRFRHDLRTPLVSVIGVLSSLQEKVSNLDDASKSKVDTGCPGTGGISESHYNNLLDVSRIEAGVVKISPAVFRRAGFGWGGFGQMSNRIRRSTG